MLRSAARTIRIPVSDLYCPCCADEVEAALKTHAGIIEAKVNHAADEVQVRYDPSTLDERAIEP